MVALRVIVVVAATRALVGAAAVGLVESGHLIALPVQILVHARRQITTAANRVALDIVDKLLLVVSSLRRLISLLIVALRSLGLVADSLHPAVRVPVILTVLVATRLTVSGLAGSSLRLPFTIALNRLDQVCCSLSLARDKRMPKQLLCRWSLI